MKCKSIWGGGVIFLAVILLSPGCVSFSTFNSPQTTPKGSGSLGAGAAVFGVGEGETGIFPEAFGRIGIAEQWDVGIKVAPHVFFSDLKYQFVDRRLDVAADLGVSYGGFLGASTIAAYPGVFVGTDHFYVGGRQTILAGQFAPEDGGLFDEASPFSGNFTTVVAGGSIGGDRVRLLPEVNLHLPIEEGDPIVMPGFGLKYRFGEGE